jgi:membrane protease subunit HflK
MSGGISMLEIAATVILLLLVGFSVRRTRLLDSWSARIDRRLGVSISPRSIKIALVSILVISYVSSGLFVIKAGERGAVKQFGRVTSAYLPPGIHYAPPIPFGSYDIESVKEIKRVEIGYRSDQPRASSISLNDNDPFSEEAWMLAGDENIIDVKCVAHYQVVDSYEAFMDYMYGVKDREALLRGAAEWALRTSVGGRAIDSLLTVDRGVVESAMHVDMQRRLDACQAGVHVVSVTLHSIHAPPPVHWAFRDVASAAEDQKQKENIAQQYWEKTTLEARGEAARLVAVAEGKASEHVDGAKGKAYSFKAQSEMYRQAPTLMKTRLYLELMDRVLPGMNKYVDLMPRKTKGPDVWLRMGPKKKQAPLGKD